MRILGCFLLLAAPLLAQEAGGAGGADPARYFPADTFAYAEVDASALKECLPAWQIARIISDPALKTLFGPAFEKLGIDPEKPLDAIQQRFPTGDYLEGRAALGVRGVSIVVHAADGREWKFRVSAETPVGAKHIYQWFGLMLAMDGPAGNNTTIAVDVDFLAVGRPGPAGRKLIADAFAEAGAAERETVKVAGLEATHLRLNVPYFDATLAFNFYVAEREGTWFVATQKDTLESALSGGPRVSLAGSKSLAQARATLTGGRSLLLAHVDLGLIATACRGLLPEPADEMGEIAGLNAMRGIGFGISLVDGGMRESLGILLDGNPRGFWRILDGVPSGLRSIQVAPPGALAVMALKLDVKTLLERILAFCTDVVPGNEAEIEREISQEMGPPGFDLKTQIAPALKDEIALLVYPARANEIFPNFVLGADARDEEALKRLVALVRQRIPDSVARFTPVDMPGGITATRVATATPYNMHLAIHKGHFFLASSPALLTEAMSQWGAEGSSSLVKDDPVLPLVVKSLNGGDADSLAALAYVNLRGCGIEALKAQAMWGAFLPREWIDPRGVIEMRRIPNHLTGVALSFRHNKDCVTIDAFSPVGVIVPAVIAGMLFERQAIMRREVAIQRARAASGRASLGITTKSSDGTGVKVLGLDGQGAAATAGLRQGDKIIGIKGVAIATMEDLDRELANCKPGESVEVKVRRGDEEVLVTVKLGEEEAGW